MPDVILISMPVVDLQRPNLGLSLLQALLEREGISSRSIYANLEFAERIGVDRYLRLANGTRGWYTIMLGETIFSRSAFPGHGPDPKAVVDYVLCPQPGYEPTPEQRSRLLQSFCDLERMATELVNDVAAAVVAQQPRLVGCTSTFQQHLPSLALLRRVRELDPNLITMLGGGNCEARMGVATHQSFPWVDYVVSGEADGLFAPMCRELLEAGRLTDPAYGILTPEHRLNGYPEDPRASFNDLDSLPFPDFSDYFEQLQASPLAPAIRPGLPLETSRGCWWGAKHHCTFCGLNGGSMAFRKKSPERALQEFEAMADRWQTGSVEIVDNILDMRYLDTVIPQLCDSPRDWNIFYEVKSNLRPEQLELLARAGVRTLQPGIESLDSRVLALMDKGAKGWQQVQFLKYARDYGVWVSWNLLCDFPGEDDNWNTEMAELLPWLAHLQPPSGVVGIRFDRFSPYFERRHEYGLTLRPHPMMQMAYPLAPETVFDLSYHFEKTSGQAYRQRPGVRALEEAVIAWRDAFFGPNPPELRMVMGDDALHITDTRPCAVQAEWSLRGRELETYLACQQGTAGRDLDASSLESLRRARLLVTLDERHLALAVSARAPKIPYVVPFPGGSVHPTQLSPQARPGRGGLFEQMFFQGASL